MRAVGTFPDHTWNAFNAVETLAEALVNLTLFSLED
jgi:hypothetical protein